MVIFGFSKSCVVKYDICSKTHKITMPLSLSQQIFFKFTMESHCLRLKFIQKAIFHLVHVQGLGTYICKHAMMESLVLTCRTNMLTAF